MIPMNSITIIWKLVSRNWLFWVGMAIGITHLFLLFYQYFYEEQTFNIGNGLVMSSFLIQGGILIFMFLGIYLQNIEKEIKLKEYLLTIRPKFWNSVTTGKFIFIFLFIIFITLFSFILFSIFVITRGLPTIEFIVESYLYILLFWGSTFFISYLVGTILSLLINNKSVYALSILISLLLGPLNTILGDHQILNFLNLGQSDYSYSYHSLYGYPLELHHIFKKWIVLTILIFLYYLLVTIKNGKLKFKNILIFTLLTVKLTLLFSVFDHIPKPVSFTFDTKSKSYQEFSYYHEDARILAQQNLIVHSYNIDLSLTPLSVSLDMEVENNSNIALNSIHLSLYHQLKVRSVMVDNTKLEFTQENDYLSIKLKESLHSKQKIKLDIDYNGESSPFYMVNSQAVYLPANFNWLPSVTIKPSVTIEDNTLHRNSTEPSYPVSYELNITGEDKIFTNLDKISTNKYSGISKGLTIVAGQLTKKKIDDTNVIIPLTWTLALEGFKELYTDLDGMLTELSKLTGKKINLPNTIVILPTTDVYDFLIQENYWLFDDHIILGYETNSAMIETLFTSENHKQYLVHSLVSAATWKKDKLISENLEIPRLFDASFAYWYHNKNAWGLEDSYFNNLMSLYVEESTGPIKKETVEKISKLMSTNNYSQQYDFLTRWYNLQIKANETDWVLLSKIADEYI